MAKVKAKKRQWAIGGAGEVRRTTFGGIPIVDAVADFSLVVRTQDVNAAKGSEKDATNCVLAKACAQQVGASLVAFFRRTAYLELPDAKGNKRVVRYMLDNDAAAIVAAFDRGKSVRGEVMVTLKAPRPGQTLDKVRERSVRAHARRAAIVKGEILPSQNQGRFHMKPTIADMDVRSGIGLVHNIVKKDKTSSAAAAQAR
jgi:hypothetical protein